MVANKLRERAPTIKQETVAKIETRIPHKELSWHCIVVSQIIVIKIAGGMKISQFLNKAGRLQCARHTIGIIRISAVMKADVKMAIAI